MRTSYYAESITTCLETSKKLQAAGFNCPTVFVWVDLGNGKEGYWTLDLRYDGEICIDESHLPYMPAPTASEIELLADCSVHRIYKGLSFKEIDYYVVSPSVETAKTEVEAKAKMWLYLKEKKLI